MSVTRPRGPLPARVYWTRRILLLSVVLLLVTGVTRLVGAPGGEQPPDPAAQPAAASPSSGGPSPAAEPGDTPTAAAQPGEAAPTTAATERPREERGRSREGRKRTRPSALPTPSGPCEDSDVRVAPAMEEDPRAGGEIMLRLELTTIESPACTWQVSADSVAVRLTSGSDRIWSSQDCPAAVPTESVVLRQRPATVVEVPWSGRRSDEECSRTTMWAEPGYYHVASAAMGSEPESQQFELRSPAPVTVTPSPKPEKRQQKKREEPRGRD